MLFGAVQGCPNKDCVNNFLTFRDGKYVCKGSSNWGKCTFTAKVNIE